MPNETKTTIAAMKEWIYALANQSRHPEIGDEIVKMLDALEKYQAAPKTEEIKFDGTNGVEILLSHEMFAILAEEIADYLYQMDAPNYVEMELVPKLKPDSRPIIITAAFKDGEAPGAKAKRLQDELAEIREQHQRIVNEQCAPDEQHCTCVPALRAEIVRLTKVIDQYADEKNWNLDENGELVLWDGAGDKPYDLARSAQKKAAQ